VSRSDDPDADRPGESSQDVVLIHGVTEDGSALEVLRAKNGELEAGALKPLREGQPIHGEVVRLRPRESCPLICDVTVDLPKAEVVAAPEPSPAASAPISTRSAARKGPAQVATNDYRRNWDVIWSSAKKPELPN
jgi:hypothetical protein